MISLRADPGQQAQSSSNRKLLLIAAGLALCFFAGGLTSDSRTIDIELGALQGLLLALILFYLLVAFRWFGAHGLLDVLQEEIGPAQPTRKKSERVAWPIFGLLAICLAYTLLEFRQPYYFSQDDNLAQFLPSVLQGCRSFFEGIFPTWNPFQFMGSPSTTVGTYALTYPFTYLSYAFAKFVLGHENATLDVFVIVHLLLGYVAIYWVLRREGCRPSLAVIGSATCILSGFALIFTRSWFYMSPVLLWTPLMILCVQSLMKGKAGWRWILGFGIIIGAYFHAGNVQMWVYSVLLVDFAIVILLLTGKLHTRIILPVVSAHFIALALSAPLLVPQLLVTQGVTRKAISAGIGVGLKALFLPDSLVHAPHPEGWNPGLPVGEMYYSGTLFVVVGLILVLSLAASRWKKQRLAQDVWLLCGLLAFVLALGRHGLLWTIMEFLPGFNRFRSPFKFLGYFNLFVVIAGAVALERLFRHRQWARKGEFLLAAIAGLVLCYHCSLATAAFYNYNFKPFPPPDPGLLRYLEHTDDVSYPKFLPLAPDRSRDRAFYQSFKHQWPTTANLFSIAGYDPLVSGGPGIRTLMSRIDSDRRQALFEYGVKYVLVYRGEDKPTWDIGQHIVYRNDYLELLELPDARPMAFSTDNPTMPLPVRFDGGGATLDTSSLHHEGDVVLNMLYRSEIDSRVNGARVPARADAWGRILIHLPSGTRTVRVAFRPPWMLGLVVGGSSLLAGLLVGAYSVRHQDSVGSERAHPE